MVNKKRLTSDQIKTFLAALGFSTDEERVYISLLKKGAMTKLNIARISGVNRTKVYRITEKLVSLGLVEEVIRSKTTLVSPTGLQVLKRMVIEKEQQVAVLQNTFPKVEALLLGIQEISDKQTKVIFFKGVDGIRQMAWNILNSKTELLGFTYRPYVEVLGKKFFVEWKKEFDFRKIRFRDIFSDEFVKRYKSLGLNTDLLTGNRSRYISQDVLNVAYQTDIYNDVVAMYNWYEGEVFGVEIHNEKIANFQRQLFEIVWNIARPIHHDIASIDKDRGY